MTPLERRSSASLALIFALRMLGLFLVLPVFALEAHKYPGGEDAALVGMAMGIYGLTQGLLQIPFGMASDRLGRKPVMVVGLVIFAAGSAMAAWAPTLPWLVAGRALQGAGAISAAVTALLADQTRDVVRTKAMALVGASIGLVFALSLVLSPLLAAYLGLHGLFAVTATLALGGIAVVLWWVPPEPAQHVDQARGGLLSVLGHPALLRLNVGVFVLHAVQLAMWVALPGMLVRAGLVRDLHWQVYLPAVLASFVVMGAALFPLEKRGYLRAVFLAAIGLIGLVQLALLAVSSSGAAPGVWMLGLLLLLFFCGFNVLEASQPSLASRVAPAASRGAALGVYNTLQSLGFFAGGAVGGWLVQSAGPQALFACCAVAMLAWLVVAWPMQAPAPRAAA
ncbi:MFS transporter [Rhodoferax sp. TS-BS-61-7]|uniref:MFS transporter n=1 Tax=Rhodoferax sp. TS-BS-61-7 TaxID=2094194 RepID=UPI000CF72BAC|nr:MFS transporter [Rhodoferax sp. TS-BS-61-7]PQA78539.1 MFS transporter [Rhodoferax sp. TS-BS-61-7]